MKRTGLLEFVVSRISGTPPETTQTENKGHTLSPKIEMKIPETVDNRSRAAGLGDMDSIHQAIATDKYLISTCLNALIFVVYCSE